MSELSREDLEVLADRVGKIVNDRFNAHEEREELMFSPIIERLAEITVVLRGEDGRSGLIKDVNTMRESTKRTKVSAHGSLFAVILNWIRDLVQ